MLQKWGGCKGLEVVTEIEKGVGDGVVYRDRDRSRGLEEVIEIGRAARGWRRLQR